MTVTLEAAARRVLGAGSRLRDVQSEALRTLVERDTLVVARSGAGKTAVYAIATLMAGRLTVVVSPLLALQRDQVTALRDAGLRADSVSSARRRSEYRSALDAAAAGRLDALLLAPEQLVRAEVAQALARSDVGLVVVDEAHCVSEWGHDFRPDYLALAGSVRELGSPRLLALTATASPHVRTDIIERLGMSNPRTLVHDADRPNIWLGVRHTSSACERDALVVRTVLEEPGAALVYARTQAHAEALAHALTDAGRPCDAYHARRPAKERARMQDDFLTGRSELLVATSAFGMGVDRGDVRLVVHAGLPPSLDSYYQEVGRAGRDEEPARALGIALPGEVALNRFLSTTGSPRPESVRAVLRAVADGATSREEVLATTGTAPRTASRVLAALVDVGALGRRGNGYAPTGMTEPAARDALRSRRERLRAFARSRADMVQTYADSSDCRRRLLLEMLGESHPDTCGLCDSCEAGTSIDVHDARLVGGQQVVHAQWGPGTVSAVAADRVTVLFDDRGYVTLDTEVALDSGLLALR